MAARGNLSVKPQKVSQGCSGALLSAVLEWLLIFFLFIDAVLSFFITRFADCCKLQTPCLLCSRLDHVLSNKKLNYYWELICGNHKLEISSLVFCHAHNKLVDVHGMCENCLLSFATINKSNAETYRLLVGKVGDESSFGCDEDPLLEGQRNTQSRVKHCSCCNEPWISRGYVEKLIQHKSIDSKNAEFDVPLSGGHNLNYLKRSDEPSLSKRVTHPRDGLETRSHVGYRELKITSDSESEILSDDDDASALIHVTGVPKEDLAAQFEQLDHCFITRSNDLALERLIDPVSAVSPSFLDSKEKSDVISTHNGSSVPSIPAVGLGLDELNWEQVDFKADHSPHSDFISIDNVSPSDAEKTSIDVSKESKFISLDAVLTSTNAGKTSTVVSKESKLIRYDVSPLSNYTEDPGDVSRESKLISSYEVTFSSKAVETPADVADKSKNVPLSSNDRDTPSQVSKDSQVIVNDNDPPMSSAMESPVEAQKETCVTRSVEVQKTSVTGNEEICKTGSVPSTSDETAVERNPILNDTGLQPTSSLDLSEAYKVAVSNRGRQLSEVLAEQWTGKDSSRLSEDLKLLLSQLSAARGFDQLTSDMSPRLSITSDEVKTFDASSSNGMQLLQKRFSLERNESGLESLDGSAVSEIEGESLVDRLKRQIEHDKKLLTAVYKELEEERNASAVAVNQAMAMITRLQEEKASLYMEALQNLRMMEEQAEYDMEALQSTNDLLAEKEKEIQDLEDELEYFRKKYPESMLENILESTHDSETREINIYHSEVTCVKASASADTKSVTGSPKTNTLSEDVNAAALKKPLIDFGEERMSILQNLKKLEKKLHMFSYNGRSSDVVNDKYSGNEGDEVSDSKDLKCKGDSQLNGEAEKTDSPMLNDASASKESDNDKHSRNEGDEVSDSKDLNCKGDSQLNGEAEERDSPMLNDASASKESDNDKHAGNEGDEVSDSKDLNCNWDSQLNGETEERDLPMLNDASASKESPFTDVHVSSLEVPLLSSKESIDFDYIGRCSPVACTGMDLVSLANEVSDLNDRLDSLEADQNFLELTINSLKQGEEGIQFIREIASHLKELRRIGVQIRDYSVA